MLLVSLESWKPKTTELCVCVTKLWVAPKGAVSYSWSSKRPGIAPRLRGSSGFASPLL